MKNKYSSLLLAVAFLTLISVASIIKSNNDYAVNNLSRLASASGERTFPQVALENEHRSEAAIAALGRHFPEVAAYYGLTEAELRDLFRRDHTLWVDKEGRLHYRDDIVVEEDGSATEVDSPIQGYTYVLEDTFRLHSKPGSNKTIYLDFDGHYFPAGSSVWNGKAGGIAFTAPAWDIDGNRAVFGDIERATIQEIWRRVSEDFAPYDVDVTTEEPTMDKLERSSLSDQVFGNRLLLSPISSLLGLGSYGGYSYIGVFDNVGEYSKISLCFPERLANGEKYMAECASHEMGHSVGLHHQGLTDGTVYYRGHGDWAPIMGNSYYEPVTQWSKGEYTNANNKEDALAIIASNGLAYRTDNEGDSISNAGTMVQIGPSSSAKGEISRTGEADMWQFNTGAGVITFNVWLNSRAPNVDTELSLYDGTGTRIAVSNPLTSLTSSISTTVAAGTYYLSVKGTGYATPTTGGYSNYASLGQYEIQGTAITVQGQAPQAVISANPTSGYAPLTVSFSGSSSYDPDGGTLTFAWNFGDGTSSTEVSPIKTYSIPGTYAAILTVMNSTGLSSMKSTTITVSDPTVISAPTNLAATVSSRIVRLTWTDTNANETSYHIYRALKPKKSTVTYAKIAEVLPNTVTYSDTVAAGTYLYKVQTYNSATGKVSAFSNEVQIRVR